MLLASARTVRIYDAIAVVWIVLWAVVGAWSGLRLWQLSGVADEVAQTAKGLDHVGQALEDLSGLPLVGSASERLGKQVRTRAADAIASAETSAQSARQLGVLVGFAIGVGPSLGVVGLYLPMRLAYAREVRAVGRAISEGDASQAEELLALRAVQNLPYDTLRVISAHPLADLRSGHHTSLAGAEAARLGLRWPPPSPEGPPGSPGGPGTGQPSSEPS